jgi:hypothetical protein
MDETTLEQTLEQLDGERWGQPEYDSHVVTESHRLRTIPIGQLSVEDLRLLIGQSIGLEWLIPLAIEVLVDDPLVAGDFYEGDLLVAVLAIENTYWADHPDHLMGLWSVRDQLAGVRDTATGLLERKEWPAFG